ncbi:MAG: ATP-binding cassette domain-containing protein [Anaerolineales bacterium]|nr:ATP-binding cassette domain-containing protein [Anaerolineales bacterium]
MSDLNEKEVLLEVKALKKYFPITQGVVKRHVGDVKAVDDISFNIYRGETLGLVGESGCGKTTAGRTILQLYEPTAGDVIYKSQNLEKMKRSELRKLRPELQIIFQDPYASLNPRMIVGNIISEAMVYHRIVPKSQKEVRVEELLTMVGLNPHFSQRFPHEFSGGQRQRIGIARALAMEPEFIVCDEPISALDVSIQAQVVNLLEGLQKELDLTYLFIAHDLSMVQHISDRVAVMYLGKIVEITDSKLLYESPQHPYTKALLSAVPIPDPVVEEQRERIILSGDVPNPANPPIGCNFNTRCPLATDICFEDEPALEDYVPGHKVACHLVEPQERGK